MPDIQVLFNPFGYNPTADWQDQLVHPRIHVGTSIGTTQTAAKQLYGGLSWRGSALVVSATHLQLPGKIIDFGRKREDRQI